MNKPPFDAESYMAIMATALGLDLQEDWKAGVIDNLRRSHQIAQGFLEFPLSDEIEPASTFDPK
jgi:hypothetical protein